MELVVHPHALKHGVTEDQIVNAWEHFVRMQNRTTPNEDVILAVDYERGGRMLQMVGRLLDGCVLIYHAMTPPTTKVLVELGLLRR